MLGLRFKCRIFPDRCCQCPPSRLHHPDDRVRQAEEEEQQGRESRRHHQRQERHRLNVRR